MTATETKTMRSGADAVSRLLTRMLTVPKIYFNAAWPDSRTQADILAIDRAGSGDVHVVEVKLRFDQASGSVVHQLALMPAHYRWIVVSTSAATTHQTQQLIAKLSKEGIGLIGINANSHGEAVALILSKPVRAASFNRNAVGDFIKQTVPDIEYGDAPSSMAEIDVKPLSRGKVKKYLDEADELLASGHGRAAYLLAWSATEAAMKLMTGPFGASAMSSPGALVREVRNSGKLTDTEVALINDALKLRNALVHGLNEPRGVGKACQNLTAIARKLVKVGQSSNGA